MRKSNKTEKTYAQKINQVKRRELRKQIEKAINHHEYFRNAYFWNPPKTSGERRKYEERNSCYIEFTYDGKQYAYECIMTCTCRNVIYNGTFSVDGDKVTVRAFNKILWELDAAINAYEAKKENQKEEFKEDNRNE